VGFDHILARLCLFIPLILALTVHEWAHAYASFRLGDDTALQNGRLTLNPLAHLDPVGTILLPLVGVPFGWAKPVPVDPSRFRPEVTMGQGLLLTAAAGPVSNLVLALLSAAALRLADGLLAGALYPAAELLLSRFTVVNLALALFNLLPIPPLDGSRIVDGLIPYGWRRAWDRVSAAGVVILVAIFVAPQLFGLGLGDWVAHLSTNLTGR
jgi:Zn-dependent protease